MQQLDIKDVYQIDGIWVANLATLGDDGKRSKNMPSHRIVPLHSQCLPLFLPWFQQQLGPKVFPLLKQKGRRAASRYFSYQLKRKKLKTRAKHLHSLRHTVTVKLIEAETPTTIQNRLLVHALGNR